MNKKMQKLKINELKEHPQNTYYFDEMEGEKWKEFIQSVKTSGVIEPIVCTQDKVIVSGHQRVRACKELGMEEIDCEIRIYDDEDKIIKDLLETNIRQRGEIGGSSVKIGRRIRELERLYGIKRGNNQHNEDVDIVNNLTQQDLIDQLGLSKNTYLNYKNLLNLIPELQDLVDDKIAPSVAARVLAKLSPEEQQDLVNTYSKEIIEKLSMTKAKELVEEYKNQSIQASEVTAELAVKNKELNTQLDQLKNQPPTIIEKEVIPDDYYTLKKEIDKLNESMKYYNDDKQQLSLLRKELSEKALKLCEMDRQLKAKVEVDSGVLHKKKLKDSALMFSAKVYDFINSAGGLAWLTEYLDELEEYEKNEYIKAIDLIANWALTVQSNINTIKIEGER